MEKKKEVIFITRDGITIKAFPKHSWPKYSPQLKKERYREATLDEIKKAGIKLVEVKEVAEVKKVVEKTTTEKK